MPLNVCQKQTENRHQSSIVFPMTTLCWKKKYMYVKWSIHPHFSGTFCIEHTGTFLSNTKPASSKFALTSPSFSDIISSLAQLNLFHTMTRSNFWTTCSPLVDCSVWSTGYRLVLHQACTQFCLFLKEENTHSEKDNTTPLFNEKPLRENPRAH